MLYQLSYASGPLSSRKQEQRQDRQPTEGCQDAAGGDPRVPGSLPGPPPAPTIRRSDHMRKGSRAEGTLGSPLWLPLPERTWGDREEPRRSPGFVDRAYSVFFEATNHSSSTRHRPNRGCSHPFLVGPRGPAEHRGYEPQTAAEAAGSSDSSLLPERIPDDRPRVEVQ
jgi:hypothetical protein